MAKKDYEKFAEMFRVELNRARNGTPERVAVWVDNEVEFKESSDRINAAYEKIDLLNKLISQTADIFQSDNSRFDRDRFFRAATEITL